MVPWTAGQGGIKLPGCCPWHYSYPNNGGKHLKWWSGSQSCPHITFKGRNWAVPVTWKCPHFAGYPCHSFCATFRYSYSEKRERSETSTSSSQSWSPKEPFGARGVCALAAASPYGAPNHSGTGSFPSTRETRTLSNAIFPPFPPSVPALGMLCAYYVDICSFKGCKYS